MANSLRRSWLLVSPLAENWFRDALNHRPDVLVVDLTGIVSESRKRQAQNLARNVMREGVGDTLVFAQVDKEYLSSDLESVVWPSLAGVIISRLATSNEVLVCDRELVRLEQGRGLESNSLKIVASLDNAQGNHNAMEIATSSKRLWGITLGRVDLEMDLGPEPSGEIHLMPYLMQRLIIIARATRLNPLGAWWRVPARGLVATPADTFQAAVRGRVLGFKGSLCARGSQVAALNEAYG